MRTHMRSSQAENQMHTEKMMRLDFSGAILLYLDLYLSVELSLPLPLFVMFFSVQCHFFCLFSHVLMFSIFLPIAFIVHVCIFPSRMCCKLFSFSCHSSFSNCPIILLMFSCRSCFLNYFLCFLMFSLFHVCCFHFLNLPMSFTSFSCISLFQTFVMYLSYSCLAAISF